MPRVGLLKERYTRVKAEQLISSLKPQTRSPDHQARPATRAQAVPVGWANHLSPVRLPDSEPLDAHLL